MFKLAIATVAGHTKLIKLDEYARLGFPGYTHNTLIHVIYFLFEPIDDDIDYHMEGVFFHLKDDKLLFHGLRLQSMPGYGYFGETSEYRMPTEEDVQRLNDLPQHFHDDPEDLYESVMNSNGMRQERYPCFAIIITQQGPITYERYRDLDFPGIAFNTKILLFYSPYYIRRTDVPEWRRLELAREFLAGNARPDNFDVDVAGAHQSFEKRKHLLWNSFFSHRKDFPNLNVPDDFIQD